MLSRYPTTRSIAKAITGTDDPALLRLLISSLVDAHRLEHGHDPKLTTSLTFERESSQQTMRGPSTTISNLCKTRYTIFGRDQFVDLTHDEIKNIIDGNKLNAIKSIRERLGIGLKEAKDSADNWLMTAFIADTRQQG